MGVSRLVRSGTPAVSTATAPKEKETTAPMSEYSSVADAKAQAAEFFGFAAGENIPITLPDGTVEQFNVPFPGMLNDDQQERWDELQFEVEQCNRHPDIVIPDHKLTHTSKTTEGEKVVETEDDEFVPGRTIKGQPILPYQKTLPDGTIELLKPGYNARLAIALWGEEGYGRFRANGGESRLIGLLQTKMQREFEERKAADPKSGSGAAAVEAVPEAD